MVPSAGLVQKYMGYAGVVAYTLGVTVAVRLVLPWTLDRLHLVSERTAVRALVAVAWW